MPRDVDTQPFSFRRLIAAWLHPGCFREARVSIGTGKPLSYSFLHGGRWAMTTGLPFRQRRFRRVENLGQPDVGKAQQ